MHLTDPDGMANNVGPDQTAPIRSSLTWVCTVCSDLCVPIFRFFLTVNTLFLINAIMSDWS